ncbi:hypothetical protein ANOM_011509 [Aspergillus nomiae NRRL 13137]|uniref:Uncharacterized protein n=1 Tax=Aspergillus nomiae NRRL (strain ATCC 15546 / NRRL 13137 / CBS 260.88 / M93) TaxID=1509407 RepID=A0A0L1IL37_ASPN3|nr:uncharacterized protein ANOM_011509 [Aspergillus nomiae NRRL 13137]KNG80232.1 hypothetical protein ANOM_011509 [Aspergillus nomiae NRRL 13137]
MPQTDERPSLNPTVEEANEELHAEPHTTESTAPRNQISWPEICAQHESVLSLHLEMLNTVRNNASNGDALQMVAGMIEKTNRLMTQFRVVKKQLATDFEYVLCSEESLLPLHEGNRVTEPGNFGASSEKPTATPTSTSSSRDSSKRRRSHSKERRKRSRMETDSMEVENESTDTMPIGAVQYQKRKRLDTMMSADDEDVRNVTPVALETEDISEEVQRRLEIKEEQRRKRSSKPEKRKRDSMASTGSTSSPNGISKPKKKTKTERPQGGIIDVPWDTGRKKKILKPFDSEQGSDVGSLEEQRRTKRQKRKSGTPPVL